MKRQKVPAREYISLPLAATKEIREASWPPSRAPLTTTVCVDHVERRKRGMNVIESC